MAFGNVYVFNLFNEPLNLDLNGTSAGIVQGWSGRFQLAAPLAVPRTRHGSEAAGRFADQTNQLRPRWDSVEGIADVAIGGGGSGVGPADDLLLFVARNRWRLVHSGGNEIASGEVRPAWS